jgi:hydrogenase maturation protease
MKKILLYGYGNPGRQDDGLGILVTQKIEAWAKENNLNSVVTDTNYQLNIEDAYNLNDYDKVIFADASIENIEDYKFHQLKPVINPQFSMHSVSPEFVIGLCQEIYNDIPDAYLLHIKGYEWDFMSELSDQANKNLSSAYHFLCHKIQAFLT